MAMIAFLRERIADPRERERDHRVQIAQLTHMLDQSQLRYNRLLDAPQPTAAPAPTPVPVSRPRRPANPCPRTLDFLREHPGPHSHGEVPAALELLQTPRHLLRHLVESGGLRRPEAGR